MSSFFRKFFGGKKTVKATNRAIGRRLELLGLEERITPATISVNGNNEVVIQLNGETITDLSTSINGSLITINTLGSSPNTGSGVGLTVNNDSVLVDTAVLTSFAGIKVTETNSSNNLTIGVTGIDLSAAPGGSNQAVSIDFTTGGVDQVNVNGLVKTKGQGGVSLNAPTFVNPNGSSITISSSGDITTTSGNVNVTAYNLTSSGDITTASGNISFGSALNLSGNIAINSTTGNLSMGIVTANGKNLTINQGSGTVALTNVVNITTGNLTITTTNATSTAIQLQNTVAAGDITLNAGGDISVSNTVTAASVNAKSTAGDVIFANTVTTSSVGGFTSETSDATKATRIANLVDVQNGANALVIGNLLATADTTPELKTAVAGTINITGKVDAAFSACDLNLTAADGAITLGGAVGAFGPLDELNAAGKTSFTANGAVTAEYITIGDGSTDFATSISFADTVKGTGFGFALEVEAVGAGTIYFAKGIEITNPGGDLYLESVNGSITVSGNILGKGDVSVESVAGAISVAGVTVDQTQANIQIISDTGNITTTGEISAKGSLSNIDIFNDYGGDITINGDVFTGTNGNIYLSIGDSSTGVVNGNMNINGALNTTGISNGRGINISSGCAGVVNVNKAISTNGYIQLDVYSPATSTLNVAQNATITGDTVVFDAQNTNNTINLASGANVTAVAKVEDNGAGNLNLASNITATNAINGIILDNLSINLTGASSLKVSGTSADITLGSVNGAQNLTLEAPGVSGSIITLTSVGQSTPLNTITVTNSGGVLFNGPFATANLVLSDTNGTVIFNGQSVISNQLTTAAKAYNIQFNVGRSVVLNGAPVFQNTGYIEFFGTTSLTSGATITGGSLANVGLAGTIVSGGAFNIGSGVGNIVISNNTQLILNSKTNVSTFESPISLNGVLAGTLDLNGVGTLTLSGDSSASTQPGDNINVTNGRLNVTGKVSSAIALTNATLSGAGGTTGPVTTTVGNVTPGGTLKTGAVTLGAATNYNIAVVSSSSANNVDVTGAVSLGSAILNLTSVASGLQAGNQLIIVNNDGSDAINGTFASLAEGATVSAKDANGNTVFFGISYKGTDGSTGNDAVLTVLGVQTMPLQPMVAGQPVLNKFMVAGADAGGGPLVTITFPSGTYTSFFAYDASFTGGVRVAAADVNGDGNLDIVTGAGAGGGPNVKVFQVNELSGAVSLQTNFFAFNAPSFTGGVYVAVGDTNNDGFSDVIVGAGATGGSRVQVYAGSANGLVTGSTLNDFFAYSPAFTGGVVVAAGFRDGIAGQDVVTAPASNGGYNIRSFNCNDTGNTPTLVDNFFAFNNTTAVGGLSLALQDLDGTPVDDIIIGSTNSQFGVVLNQTGSSNPNTITVNPFPGFTGAIRAGVAQDANFNYAVAAAGPGGGPVTTVYQVINGGLSQTDSLFVLNPQFTGGLFVSS